MIWMTMLHKLNIIPRGEQARLRGAKLQTLALKLEATHSDTTSTNKAFEQVTPEEELCLDNSV